MSDDVSADQAITAKSRKFDWRNAILILVASVLALLNAVYAYFMEDSGSFFLKATFYFSIIDAILLLGILLKIRLASYALLVSVISQILLFLMVNYVFGIFELFILVMLKITELAAAIFSGWFDMFVFSLAVFIRHGAPDYYLSRMNSLPSFSISLTLSNDNGLSSVTNILLGSLILSMDLLVLLVAKNGLNNLRLNSDNKCDTHGEA